MRTRCADVHGGHPHTVPTQYSGLVSGGSPSSLEQWPGGVWSGDDEPAPRTGRGAAGPHRARGARVRAGLAELGLVVAVYVGYSLTRLVADESVAPAAQRGPRPAPRRALGRVSTSRRGSTASSSTTTGSAWPAASTTPPRTTSSPASSWSGCGAAGPEAYLPARRALVLATAVALVLYVLVPMAPAAADGRVRRRAPALVGPRLVGRRGLGAARARAATPTSSRRSRRCTPAGRCGSPGCCSARSADVRAACCRPVLRLDARGHHRAGHRRHRQPLGARRGRRLGGRRRGRSLAVRPMRTAVPAPFAPAPGRSSSTSAAGSP